MLLCWTSAVWTEQCNCLNDLAALCTIIHLTGGSQCPAEGLHLLWPLALHSDKGTSKEYFRDPQHMYIDVYGCILIFNIFILLSNSETHYRSELLNFLFSILHIWRVFLSTDALGFSDALVMLVKSSTHVQQLSVLATNFTAHLESCPLNFIINNPLTLSPSPELVCLVLAAVFLSVLLQSCGVLEIWGFRYT